MYRFRAIVEKDESGYYVASIPAVPGCHTQGNSMEEAISGIKEALERLLISNGFIPRRQKGSHKFFRNPITNRSTLLPMHNRDVGKGLLRKILRDTRIDPNQLLRK